jgi:uncharacterized protein YjbI with pentapeptide repeats
VTAARAPRPPRLEHELAARTLAADELAADPTLTETRLINVDLGGARVRGLRLTDVSIEGGNLANLVAPELSLSRIAVSDARLTGAQWTRGRIADTLFRDCRVDLATFAGTTFERATFEGCRLAQADFREALLRSVRFDRCDLTEADLTGVRIDRCELRGCTLERLTGIERLRGAAMPWVDVVGHAGLLAAALGIRVLDEDAPSA